MSDNLSPVQRARLNRAKARVRHLVNKGVKFNAKAASKTLINQATKNAAQREFHGLGISAVDTRRLYTRSARATKAGMHKYR